MGVSPTERGHDMPDTPRAEVELRLALVCYGGVSLAIYMHGMTKELHKLVVASRAFDADPAANPFDAGDSCAAYYDALADLAAQGRSATVAIDVVAGTSAGGINGICLAKVLARNGSQDALKSLWIKEGDFKTLLKAPPIGGWRTRAVLAALRVLPRLRKPVAPLRGDLMSRLLYGAIDDMDAPVPGGPRSLLDSDSSLDLYVTATDLYGATVRVATGAGGVAQRETDHAQVIHFRADSARNDFAERSTAPLAFAARATSCFPGAFPPVSRQSFAKEVAPQRVDIAAIAARFRNRYGEKPGGGYGSDDAWFADGGVLDNAPFDLVVRAIGTKRAETEVVRRLVYIEPDPGGALDKPAAIPAPHDPPGYAAGLRQGALTVRGTHSILRELLNIRDLNVRIEAVGTIARAQMKQVAERVEQAWDATRGRRRAGAKAKPWDIDNPQDVEELAERIYDGAPEFLGAGYEAYQRLKVEAAAGRLADAVTERYVYPPESGRTGFLRAALSAWTRLRVGDEPLDREAVDKLLGPVDVPYRERRLMFILAGINDLYGVPGGPPRAGLNQLKRVAWTLLAEVRDAACEAVAGAADDLVDFLRLREDETFADPDEFAAENDKLFEALYEAYRADLDTRLGDMKARMWTAFATVTPGWTPEHRRALLSRFLGFPLWDGLIFPTISLSSLPQFTPIDVVQFSPIAARALTPPGGAGKLKGVALHHFGAFADEEWRENDYLWGRLDGAELILRTLRETGSGEHADIPANEAAAIAAAGPRLKAALSAILASEADITRGDEFAWLRAAVTNLPAG